MNRLLQGRGVLLTAAACLVGLMGCDEPKGTMVGTDESTQMPAIKVDLPPPPSFADSLIPQSYPDGTLSVYGLRKQKDKYFYKEVKVKAYLLEIYQCPVCPKGQTCKLCDQPHFFLADLATGKKEKALMVVDYLMPKQKPPMLTLGKQYLIEGTFSRNSPTGFADSEGLLQFTRMLDDKNVEFLSPTAQLEAKIQKGQAEEAARLAKPPGKSQKNK